VSDGQNVCVQHGWNVLHEEKTYMPLAC